MQVHEHLNIRCVNLTDVSQASDAVLKCRHRAGFLRVVSSLQPSVMSTQIVQRRNTEPTQIDAIKEAPSVTSQFKFSDKMGIACPDAQ